MTYSYTVEDKARIKANPMNRDSCKNIRAITTWKYREFKAAEVSLAGATDKTCKELQKKYDELKGVYEEALNKFNLYKEIFPDIVQ